MATDATVVRVSELIAAKVLVINDGYRAKNNELSDRGLPFARAGNLNMGFRFADVDRFPVENLSRVGEKVSRPGDVVFTSKGTVGRFGYVNDLVEMFVYSPQLCFWRSLDHEVIDPRWLYYWMHSPEFFDQYTGVKGQTDMADYVSLGDQRRMSISLPTIERQRGIARVLSTLDAKISTNLDVDRTLLASARRIFRSWFVDFDPVRAKAAGARHFAGVPTEIFAQMPDKLQGSEIGDVPDGWSVRPIGELVDVLGGGTPSTRDGRYWDGAHPFCTPKDMSRLASPVLLDTDRHLTDLGVQRVSSGLVPAGTVLLSSRAPIGYLAIARTPLSINQGIIAMHAESIPSAYTLFWAESNMDRIKARAGGSTFPEISKRNFRPILALEPGRSALEAFGRLTRPMLDLMEANARESEGLRVIRDRLIRVFFAGELAHVGGGRSA